MTPLVNTLTNLLNKPSTNNILLKSFYKYNIERVYFPYWLHKLLPGLLEGSFLRRPWSGTLNRLKTRLQNATCIKIQNYSDPVIQKQFELQKIFRNLKNIFYYHLKLVLEIFNFILNSIIIPILVLSFGIIPSIISFIFSASSISTP